MFGLILTVLKYFYIPFCKGKPRTWLVVRVHRHTKTKDLGKGESNFSRIMILDDFTTKPKRKKYNSAEYVSFVVNPKCFWRPKINEEVLCVEINNFTQKRQLYD